MIKTTLKGFALSSMVALFAAGQALAHTGVRDVAVEGTSSYNGFTITHGCGGDSGQGYPVIGQAALFPFGADAVFRDAAGNVIPSTTVPDPDNLDDNGKPLPKLINNGGGIISTDTLSLAVAGIASFSSPFVTTQEIVDELGTVHALLWKDGALEPKLYGITSFKISAPTIVPNCTRLRVRVGVINYCDTGKNAANDAAGPWKAPKDAFGRPIPLVSDINDINGGIQLNVNASPVFKDIRAGNGDNNRADWWFANLEGGSALYNDPDLTAEGNKLWSAAINVNSDAAGLAGCATITDVTVEPSGAAFDKYLTAPNTHPFTKGGHGSL
jgi:hypothetical protein